MKNMGWFDKIIGKKPQPPPEKTEREIQRPAQVSQEKERRTFTDSQFLAFSKKYANLPIYVIEAGITGRTAHTLEGKKRDNSSDMLAELRKIRDEREKTKEQAVNTRYQRLSLVEKQEFNTLQAEAVRLVTEHCRGKLDVVCLPEEEWVVEQIQNKLRIVRETGQAQSPNFEDQEEQKIFTNFVQRIAFKLFDLKRAEQRASKSVQRSVRLSDLKSSALPESAPDAQREASKEWRDVQRDSVVECIGDLNGSYTSLIEHLKEQNLITVDARGAVEWRGGDEKVVFLGDILGDRNPEGIKTMRAIGELREKAKRFGGDIEVIAGNHEEFFLAFATGMQLGTEVLNEKSRVSIGAYVGNFELLSYAPNATKQHVLDAFNKNVSNTIGVLENKKRKNEAALQIPGVAQNVQEAYRKRIQQLDGELRKINELRNNIAINRPDTLLEALRHLDTPDNYKLAELMETQRSSILTSMRSSPDGKKTLETIAELKLVTTKDDTLFTHTNLTAQMADELLKGDNIQSRINEINQMFQKGLRQYLLGERNLSGQEMQQFNSLKTIFLETHNRQNFSETLSQSDAARVITEFKKRGINLIMHGHYNEDKPFGTANFPIVSIDGNSFKGLEEMGSVEAPMSAARIQKDGTIGRSRGQSNIRSR